MWVQPCGKDQDHYGRDVHESEKDWGYGEVRGDLQGRTRHTGLAGEGILVQE